MYEFSRDYLNKLIAESGIKVGTAKSTAVAAIIELIDENSMNGLIKSIKSDYEYMTALIKERDTLKAEVSYQAQVLKKLESSQEIIKRDIQKEKAALDELREQKQEAEIDASIAGCNDADKSRLLAYKAAIEIGKAQFDGRVSDDTMKQILRSASNVAANWERPAADSTGDADLCSVEVTRERKRRAPL